MIVFEVVKAEPGNDPDTLEISLDEEGLSSLLAQLRFLSKKETDHVHLMSDDWGGHHLSTRPLSPGHLPLHHVKICLRQLG